MGKSQRMQNLNGSGSSYLNVAARKDGASSAISNAVKSAKKEQQDLVKGILTAVRAEIVESDVYNKTLDLKTADVVLMRIASLLDEAKESFVEQELEEAKQEILDEIKGLSIDTVLKNFILGQITDLFDDDAKKEDIEGLKSYLAELLQKNSANESSSSSSPALNESEQPEESNGESESESTFAQKKVDSIEDEKEGDYQDSTIAKNFQVLQDVITKQLEVLNSNVKSITGISVFSGFVGFASKGISSLLSGVGMLGSKVSELAKSTVSKITNISKIVAGGALAGMSKAIGGIAKGIGSVIGSVKGIGSKIGGAFKSLGSKIGGIGTKLKGMGSKIGGAVMHPFKTIGSFFGKSKADKAAAKREKLREKFMGFMMKMFEKLWDFLEPILSKLKIYMLVTLVPILIVAVKVLLILAAITAIVVGIVLAVMWVKNKLLPKIKALWNTAIKKVKEWWKVTKAWFAGLWEGFKQGLVDIWNGILYIVSFKWLVDFGKWVWKQLVAFGDWLYKKFIYLYLVAPIKWLRDKLTTFLTPIMQKLQPFIESAQNLFARLKAIWAKFNWDENKSFFENLKCLASIVKDAVLDWWNTSPFKTFYETYLDPIIKSVQDLIGRIKSIWANFAWDENKSFLDNLADFWDQCWSAIGAWWEQSPIKQYWDKLVDYVSDLLKPLRDWYNESKLKEWIDKIGNWVENAWTNLKTKWNESALGQWFGSLGQKIDNLKSNLSKMSFSIPTMGMDWSKWDKWSPLASMGKVFSFGWKEIKPFGFLTGSAAEGAIKVETLSAPSTDSREGPTISQQQVTNAMKPVNSINSMNADTGLELQKTGEEMSTKAAAAEQATQDYRQQQSMIGSQSLSELHDMREEMRRGFKDPAVVPLPMPYGPQRNAAMMYNEEAY